MPRGPEAPRGTRATSTSRPISAAGPPCLTAVIHPIPSNRSPRIASSQWAFTSNISWSTKANCPKSTSRVKANPGRRVRSEEHTSELQSRPHLVCRLLLEKKKKKKKNNNIKKKKQQQD